MQISQVEVIPLELTLQQPVRMANLPEIKQVSAIFIRIETLDGLNAWGCAIAHPNLTGESAANALRICRAGADLVPDLHPTNLEYSLAELAPVVNDSLAARCAFDLAFHDLLGLAAGMPLYRLLGGYRNRIQTSATIPISSIQESVERAKARAAHGFRMLKIKGGLDPEEDVQRVRAISKTLPGIILRLDTDGGYSIQQALDVARALEGKLEMIEQPTPFDDLEAMRQVTSQSPVPILADQSVTGPESALGLAANRAANGVSIKVACCGGLRCARQMDAIARAARMVLMVSCLIEPALLIAAGLSFALSSPNVRYADLDGHLDLLADPTIPGFLLEDGWLVATDSPGLGCRVGLEQ
jgi:L-alanine-DL-glutamate epimerase-like enolase superfamily enzyme